MAFTTSATSGRGPRVLHIGMLFASVPRGILLIDESLRADVVGDGLRRKNGGRIETVRFDALAFTR